MKGRPADVKKAVTFQGIAACERHSDATPGIGPEGASPVNFRFNGAHPRQSLASAAKAAFLVFTMLLALTFATRWGGLLTEVYDWDESTMILVGSGFAKGALPYVDYWDNKPPLHFLLLGWAMRAFGETLAVVRTVGILAVAIAAHGVFLICRRSLAFVPSVLAASMLIAVASVPQMQPTMTEQLAIAFLVMGTWVLLAHCESLMMIFLAGLLLSCAALTRSNLAVPALAVAFSFAIGNWIPGRILPTKASLVLLVAGFLPVALIASFYAANGYLWLLIVSNLQAPMAYATGQTPAPALLFGILGGWVNFGFHHPATWGLFTVLALAGLVLPARRGGHDQGGGAGRTSDRWSWIKSDRFVLGVMASATLTSMAISGAFVWHHLLQLAPFAALSCGRVMAEGRKPWQRLAGSGVSAAIVLAALFQTFPDTITAITAITPGNRVGDGQWLANAAAAISADAEPEDRVFALEGHLIYWYLGMKPPTPAATHPSTIVKRPVMKVLAKFGIARAEEFAHILSTHPRYIVTGRAQPWYLNQTPEGDLYDQIIGRDYAVWRRFGETVIHRRR